MSEFNFENNATVSSLDDIPSKYHGLYEEFDGKFNITENVKSLVEDYTGTVKSLVRSRADKKKSSDESAERRNSLKELDQVMDSLGLEDKTPEGLTNHVNELLAKVKGGQAMQVNLDKIQAQADSRIAEAVATKDTELTAMRVTLDKHLVNDVAVRVIAAAKGSPELLLPHIRQSCKVVQDGDNYVVRVVDNQGDVRSDGAGGWLSVEAFVSEMKNSDVYARAFESEQKGGSGTPPGSGKGSSSFNQRKDASPNEKIAAGLAKLGVK